MSTYLRTNKFREQLTLYRSISYPRWKHWPGVGMHNILSFDSNPFDFNTKRHIMAVWVAWMKEWGFGVRTSLSPGRHVS